MLQRMYKTSLALEHPCGQSMHCRNFIFGSSSPKGRGSWQKQHMVQIAHTGPCVARDLLHKALIPETQPAGLPQWGGGTLETWIVGQTSVLQMRIPTAACRGKADGTPAGGSPGALVHMRQHGPVSTLQHRSCSMMLYATFICSASNRLPCKATSVPAATEQAKGCSTLNV